MKPVAFLSIVLLAIGTGCPPPEPEPVYNVIRVVNDVPTRIITEVHFRRADLGPNVAFSANRINVPLTIGEGLTLAFLVDGEYQLKVGSVPLAFGNYAEDILDLGLLEGGTNTILNYSTIYP